VVNGAERGREYSIYPNLKLRIYSTGMRQKHLAKLAGIDEHIRLKIAKVLGSDVEWLFQEATIETTAGMVPGVLGPA